jgi:hypothetical protein
MVPLGRGHLPHRLVHRDAGVVDQDVEVPVLIDDLVDDPHAVLVAADVALVDGHAMIGVLVGEQPGIIVVA